MTPTRVTTPAHLAIGFITNFFDTLGIGSYATTTAIYRCVDWFPTREYPAR